jgi:SNF family Na+-dependent transporter
LFARAVIEPGAIDGIKYYLRPDLSALFRAQVWGDAAAQVRIPGLGFLLLCNYRFSTRPGYAKAELFASRPTIAFRYRFLSLRSIVLQNNLYRDAMVVTFGNSLTSIFSGFVVFRYIFTPPAFFSFIDSSVFLDSWRTAKAAASTRSVFCLIVRVNVSVIVKTTQFFQVVTSGPGLTFIAYPQAVTTIPWAPFWSALFFLMLVTLALSTMFPTVENIATALVDQFPRLLRPYKARFIFLIQRRLFPVAVLGDTRTVLPHFPGGNPVDIEWRNVPLAVA